MIVEFCKYGNLSNYLRGKRDDFRVYKVSLKLHDWNFPEFLLSHHSGYKLVSGMSSENPMHVSSGF